MRYTYRCACGAEATHTQPMRDPVPEELDLGDHLAGPLGESRTLCAGGFQRVYEVPRTNLGYRPSKHTENERWAFRDDKRTNTF